MTAAATLIRAIIVKSDEFARSLGNPRPLRARARLGARAYEVITAPFGGLVEKAAIAVGCERIERDLTLGPEDAVFERITEGGQDAT